MTRNGQVCKGAINAGQRLNMSEILLFSLVFFWPSRCFRSITRVFAQFFALSLNPASWWHDSGQAVPWQKIAGGASLMLAGRESLMQKRAGEVFPNLYRKLEFGN